MTNFFGLNQSELKGKKMKAISRAFAITITLLLTPVAFSQTDVSVLIVYTDDARAAAGGVANMETEIISAIDDGNLALNNSNVDINLSIAGMREVLVNENIYSGTSSLLADLTDPNDATFNVVHQWRDQNAADLVYLIFEGIVQNGQANAICGAGVPCDQSFESKAFATGQRALQDIAPLMIHELGHVMGLRHDRTRDCGTEAVNCGQFLFPYSFGHIDPIGRPDWGTIMAGGRPFPLLDFFSNPNLDNPDTGQALGVADRSDAARALNDVREIIANFRQAPTPTPSPTPTPPPRCEVKESFESGAGGWRNDSASTCSSGRFIVRKPRGQSSGGVRTQVGRAAQGANAFFTDRKRAFFLNRIADVNRGNCIARSPAYSITQDSTLSLAYFFGQRDGGDDPTQDFQRIEVSTNGGSSFQTLVANGDTRSKAKWQKVTQTIPAGSSVVIRAQCADGSGNQDIVECGLDNVTICSN